MFDSLSDPVLHLIYQGGHNGYGQNKVCAICGTPETKLKVYTTQAERYTKERAEELGLTRCIDVIHKESTKKEREEYGSNRCCKKTYRAD